MRSRKPRAREGAPVEVDARTESAYLRQMAQSIDEVFWMADLRNPRLLYVSPGYETIWGRSCESLYADPRSFLENVHPEDRPRRIAAAEARLRGESVELEYRIIRPDGQVRHIFDRGLPVQDANGAVTATCGVWVDITELKNTRQALRETQERFRWVAENSTDMISVHSLAGVFRYASPACRSLLGYEPNELTGRDVYEFLHRDDLERLTAAHMRVVETGRMETIESRIKRRDGNYGWFESTVRRTAATSKHAAEIIAVTRDISQRKRDEELLHRRQTELAHVSRLAIMGEMAAGVAHELNQPLAAIINYSEALRRRAAGRARAAGQPGTPRKKTDELEQIIKQAERAATIIRRMRRFAKKTESRCAVTDINDVVNEAVQLLETDLRSGEVNLKLDLAPRVPGAALDTVQITQVIINLARNALDAMIDLPPMERKLIIRTGARGRKVEIDVWNAGPSIPTSSLERIFEPFFTTKDTGLGMGLAISRRLVEAHGGKLWAEASGRGALLRMTLPAEGRRRD